MTPPKEKARYSLDFEKPILELESHLESLRRMTSESRLDVDAEIRAISTKLEATKRRVHANLTPWQKIQLARHPNRPYALDYVGRVFRDFQELHGDRQFRDDAAIVGGTAFLGETAVMLICQQKGRSTKENLHRNFGCPAPEGYRKALRLMKLAEKFGLPVISLVDTPGAYPGVTSEERHVAEAIAVNLREMADLDVPSVAVVIGEGGSGGALGIAVSDRVLILENAYYSVISPEGCAAILWKDRIYAPQAAEALKITADKLKALGIVDAIVPEPLAGAHTDHATAASMLGDALKQQLAELKAFSLQSLKQNRYEKFRRMGDFIEPK